MRNYSSLALILCGTCLVPSTVIADVVRANILANFIAKRSKQAGEAAEAVIRHGGRAAPGDRHDLRTVEVPNSYGWPLVKIVEIRSGAAADGAKWATAKSVWLRDLAVGADTVTDSAGTALPMRIGTWWSRESHLGGLFSFDRTTVVQAHHAGDAADPVHVFVEKNRKTLRIVGVPVLPVGRAFDEYALRDVTVRRP